jgi:hypothetical protein
MPPNTETLKTETDSTSLESKGEKEFEWEVEFYKQGSDACRNYSQLTMRVRTLSQQVLVGSSIGLAALLSRQRKLILQFFMFRLLLYYCFRSLSR